MRRRDLFAWIGAVSAAVALAPKVGAAEAAPDLERMRAMNAEHERGFATWEEFRETVCGPDPHADLVASLLAEYAPWVKIPDMLDPPDRKPTDALASMLKSMEDVGLLAPDPDSAA